MRNVLILLLAVLGLAILRGIIRDVGRTISRAMKSSGDKKAAASGSAAPNTQKAGRLVKDPQTGTYIDPAGAAQAEIDGTVYYFESSSSRDEYVRARKNS